MAVLMASLVSATTGAPGASAAPSCPDIEVVFARGTDEPAGIGRVGQALVDSLKPLVKGKSIGTYAVDYPASYDFLAVAQGANDASTHIQSMAAKCPDTKMVLGGYSQGAAVIDVITTAPIAGLGFAAPMPAAIAGHIAAVAVFGNPSARLGQPLTRMSQVYGARTADMCNTADPICSLGNNFDSHVKYPESGLVKTAAKWVADHIIPPPQDRAAQKDSSKADSAQKSVRAKS
ncbi:cutinase family protein [Mycolicibacterium komossense]|uniref:Cutinase family protein n=1 Tax=Mycolicibacterium komossense TaxID=1779 RepID=A0ABT3CAQ4_9MYCO|nr:cutinase family protein [Mycolicibacterium komossense]MCV7226543.1 cutinase family protein [Mycolicibacterium komossense]